MELKQSNPKAFETIALALKSLSGLTGKVGWFPGAEYEDGTPVAYVAALNEVGHGSTPPRPFMRPTAIEEKKEWSSIAAQGSREVVKGRLTGEGVMEILTKKAEDDVAKTITALTSPPLSPVTIEIRAMKKRNPDLKVTGAIVGQAAEKVKQPGYETPNVSVKPLNDSGHMINTLTHVVIKE